MALDINGYNATFKAFADFAANHIAANDGKTIANATVQQPLGGRKTVSVDVTDKDYVHNWTRGVEQWTVNDRTRALFKKAVADMFGGEANIPDSVKDAMLLADYNQGKPLTARRILAVKAAIDADGTAKARAAKLKLETFQSKEIEDAALAMGFKKSELPNLARAVHLYAKATGRKEMDALKEVATPGTDANRLMNYGGRFMENADNFCNGLRLIRSFAEWYKDLKAGNAALEKKNYAAANTPSKLNASIGIFTTDCSKGLEKFVFEAFACDPSVNLAETDTEKLFGFENNAACRFFGRGFGNSCTSTIANIPPEKRNVVYASFDLFCRLAANSEETQDRHSLQLTLPERPAFLARVVKNLDKLEALLAKGQLTAKNFIKTAFPDMRDKTGYDLTAIRRHNEAVSDAVDEKYDDINEPIQLMMEETGCTYDEAGKALRGTGPMPERPRYASTGQLGLATFDGTTKGGREAIEGDLYRPQNYSLISDGKDLLPQDGSGFGFKFPGEERFITNQNPQLRPNITKVGDKVEEMCGKVHAKQANSVMMMLSQSGLGPLNRGLKAYGVNSREHAAVEYTLSKDDATGAVTIKYESPKALPFRFEWTATVDVDGNVSATPLKFEKPSDVTRNEAKKLVADAAKAMGIVLDKAKTAKAVAFVQEFGKDMYAQNRAVFAKFVVQMKLTEAAAAQDRLHAEDMSNSIRKWRDVQVGDGQLKELENVIKDYANDDVTVALGNHAKFDKNDPNIYTQIRTDGNRGRYVINGQTIPHPNPYDNGDSLVAAIKQALPVEKAHKIATILMHQETLWHVKIPQMKGSFEFRTGDKQTVQTSEIPGADTLINNNSAGGLYIVSIDKTDTKEYRLDVSPDGNSAKITTTYKGTMLSGYGVDAMTSIGTYTLVEEMTLDFKPEVPVVADVKLSQTFSA